MRTWTFLIFLWGIAHAHHHLGQQWQGQRYHYQQQDGVHGSWSVAQGYELKQQEIQSLVDLINKPVRPEYEYPDDVVDKDDLHRLGHLPRDEVFSLFDERNTQEVIDTIRILYEAPTYDEFLSRARVIRQRVNEDLFLYGLSVAITIRNDTRGIHVPRVHDIYPDKFLTRDVIQRIKEATRRGHYRDVVPVIDATEPEAYNSADPSQQLAYFLNDVARNSHHYYWHVLHPAVRGEELGGASDRQGEIFYWTHKQMVARYDTELLSNQLPRATPFENWNEPIEIGYSPNLAIDKTGYQYAYRPSGVVLKDLRNLPRNKMIQWRNNLVDSIHEGYLLSKNGTHIKLDNNEAINYIASALEASRVSVNRRLYGNLHNYAHVIASKVTTPSEARWERNGVMYDVATSARDPLFYSWHKYIDNILQEHKEQCSYSREERSWDDVEVNSVQVVAYGDHPEYHQGHHGHGGQHWHHSQQWHQGGRYGNIRGGHYWNQQNAQTQKNEQNQQRQSQPNVVRTYWQNSVYEIGKGFTYTPKSKALVKLHHLNHEPYNYSISVTNNAGSQREVVVRIFGALTEDERGHTFDLNEQRHIVLELDKFRTVLKPGQNKIERSSLDSSVTSHGRSFYEPVERLYPEDACQCGFPNYLLLPRGQPEGTSFQIYVVLTNAEEDIVQEQHHHEHQQQQQHQYQDDICWKNINYCGSPWQRYPDRRPLGYPFDKRIDERNFDSWRTSNMGSTNITIYFTGEYMEPSYREYEWASIHLRRQ